MQLKPNFLRVGALFAFQSVPSPVTYGKSIFRISLINLNKLNRNWVISPCIARYTKATVSSEIRSCHESEITDTGMFFVSHIAKITLQISRLLERKEFHFRDASIILMKWTAAASRLVWQSWRRLKVKTISRLCTIAVPVLGNFSLLFKCVSFQLCSVFARNRFAVCPSSIFLFIAEQLKVQSIL